MDAAALLAFNAALLAALAAPGPALLMAVQTTLSAGRGAGIRTGLGLATVAAGWTCAALFGLDGLFRLFPGAYAALKVGGALYLLWIAVRMWRSATAPLAPPRAARRAFLDGALVNLGNPKSVLFAAAVLVVIFPPGMSAAARLGITLNHLAVEALAYTALALLLSRAAVRARYLAARPALDRVAAAVLGALGVRLLTDLRP